MLTGLDEHKVKLGMMAKYDDWAQLKMCGSAKRKQAQASFMFKHCCGW